VGEIKIKELRTMATEELKDKFDLRSFHDEIMAVGPVPLSFLENTIKSWVARVKANGK